MLIKGFLGTSLIDFPGHVASLAFVGGCNFRCPFCHNRDLVRGFLKLPTLSEESVLDDLAKRKGFIDGVEVTGGEPCLYADLPAFLRRVKSLGYPVKLDTNGYFPKALSSLLEEGLVDYVAMDVKTSPEKYAQTVGKVIDLSRIGRSIRMILDRAPDYEFPPWWGRKRLSLSDGGSKGPRVMPSRPFVRLTPWTPSTARSFLPSGGSWRRWL